jgi:DHA1 family multidrug resistance protein-like MFS transporter
MLAVAGMALILPILPLIVRDLGIEEVARVQRWSGAIFAAPFLFAALMTPVWGWVGDRVGRKAMVVRALLGLSVAIFLMGFARRPVELLALRIVQGMVSGFIPAAIALVSASAPRAQMGYALGTLSSAQAAGVVVGPLLGGLLADAFGFRNLFFITAAIEVGCGLAVFFLVHETRHARGVDRGSVRTNARYALHGPIAIALCGLFLTQTSIVLVQPFFALFVESLGVERARLSSATGLLFGITGLTTLIAAPRWGRISDRIGRRRALLIAFAAGCVVFALQAAVRNVEGLFVLRALQGLCAAAMLPALYATIAAHAPDARRGGIVAFGSSATLLGGLAGPVLGGLLASRIGMRPVFLVSTALFAVNILNALRLPPERAPGAPVPRRSWELPTQ